VGRRAADGRRRLVVVAVCVALAVVLAGCQGSSAGGSARLVNPSGGAAEQPVTVGIAPEGPQPVPGKVMLGAYVGLNGLTGTAAIDLRRQQLGRDFRVLNWFYEWDDSLPTNPPHYDGDPVEMYSWRGTDWNSIINGSQDTFIAAQADHVKKYGKPVFLRWAWEMNGNWFPWDGAHNGQDPSRFILAWRHVHDIFQQRGATNVAWVWAPNWQSHPSASWNELDRYYPGDDYVDWVGVDGYSDSQMTPDDLFDTFYQRYAGRKPIMLAETGVHDTGGTSKPDWIDSLGEWAKAHPSVAALCWFDTDINTDTVNDDYRIDSTPASLEAFRRLANDPHFQG
jgi:hypothetical protein